MKRLSSLISGILLLIVSASPAQNISGIVNNYASVNNISGTGISVASAAAFRQGDKILLIQMKGATIDQTNTSTFGDLLSMGGAGTFEFLRVSAIIGNVITVTSALTNTY